MTNQNGQAPAPKDRRHPQLWQAYLWWDELVTMRKRHTTRIKHVEAGRSNMDAQLERDVMEHVQLDALIKYAAKTMHNYGRAIGLIWEHATSIKGIGDNLAAQLFAHVDDVAAFATISKLWRFAGLAVINGRAERKNSQHYNRRLKSVCWLISDQFVRHQTGGYADIYYTEKERQRAKHPEPVQVDGKWRYNDAHIDRRAKRKTEKIFLQHLWLRWRELEGLPVSKPYVHDKLGHENIITPEDCGWPVRERELA